MALNLFCLTIYALMALLLFGGMKRQSQTTSDELFSRLNSLRGLFALEIVLGHCVRYDSCLLTPLGNFMLISVGFFFFISGFGLARSFNTKPDYLKHFIRRRIVHLILVALTALAFTTIIAVISPVSTDFDIMPASVSDFITALFVRNNWYIRELLILYIIFFVVFSCFKSYRILVTLLSTFLLCIPLYFLGYTRCWFASLICFPFGMFVYTYYDKVIRFLLSAKGIVIASLVFLMGTALSLVNYPTLTGLAFNNSEMLYAAANNIMCLGFAFVLVVFVSFFKPHNIILSFLTGHSMEIFMFQFVFIVMAEKMQLSVIWKIAFVVVLDIVVSVVLHQIMKRIK